jgi:hypothetical protein
MKVAPTHHTPAPSRAIEAAQHGTKPHCLDKPPVAKGYPIAVHGGMHHVSGDAFNAGISPTAAAAALQGGKLPTDPPKVGKVTAHAPVAWNQKSVGAERHDATGAQANKVLQEAYRASGKDHPNNLGRQQRS